MIDKLKGKKKKRSSFWFEKNQKDWIIWNSKNKRGKNYMQIINIFESISSQNMLEHVF